MVHWLAPAIALHQCSLYTPAIIFLDLSLVSDHMLALVLDGNFGFPNFSVGHICYWLLTFPAFGTSVLLSNPSQFQHLRAVFGLFNPGLLVCLFAYGFWGVAFAFEFIYLNRTVKDCRKSFSPRAIFSFFSILFTQLG